MFQTQHDYAIELVLQDGATLGQVPVAMDWAPGVEWARFMALRQGRGEVLPRRGGAVIEPVWDAALGAPFVGAVRVRLAGPDSAAAPVLLPRAYFHRAALEARRRLAAPREPLLYRVIAYPNGESTARPDGLSLTIEEVDPPLGIRTASLPELSVSAAAVGPAHELDAAVLIPQAVLDCATALSLEAGADETAGILIGHLCRDVESRQLFLQLSDLLPAGQTRAKATEVTFTPATWAAVEAALRLRRCGEIWLGWFHSHPAKHWCPPSCPAEVRRACPLQQRSVFSAADCGLHRAVFPLAHSVALVVTVSDAGVRQDLYGWREGLIVQRGFSVLHAAPGVRESVVGDAVVGESYEKACP
jgi:proteasome lid subunit RPN8/RPN11